MDEDWQDIDGINVGNPGDVEAAAHADARAQQDEQDGKQEGGSTVATSRIIGCTSTFGKDEIRSFGTGDGTPPS